MKTTLQAMAAALTFSAAAACSSQGREDTDTQASQVTAVPAFTLAAGGSCPTFHCTPEGTGLMALAVPLGDGGVVWRQSQALDAGLANAPGAQSCSSDGRDFTCLYQSGQVTALTVNAADGSVDFALDGGAGGLGTNGTKAAVALVGSDGSIIVADDVHTQRRDRTGAVLWDVPAPSNVQGTTIYGITPVVANGETFAVITYSNGTLTPYFATDGGVRPSLDAGYAPASDPVAHDNTVYYVGIDGSREDGVLLRIALQLDPATKQLSLVQRASFGFTGKTGASALYLAAGAGPDGGTEPLVLVHVPTGEGDAGAALDAGSGSHLVAVDPTTLQRVWATPLEGDLAVSPVVDPVNGGVWLFAKGDSARHLTHVAPSGKVVLRDTIPLSTLGFSPTTEFTGHIFSTNTDGGTYVLGGVGDDAGTLDAGAVAVVIDVAAKKRVFAAAVPGLASASYNGALPLVMLGDGGAGMVFAGVDTGGNHGNVVVLGGK
ncbi:MAG TPA: hypothetical protein VGI39_19070 [Polyangiaceae bacterium]